MKLNSVLLRCVMLAFSVICNDKHTICGNMSAIANILICFMQLCFCHCLFVSDIVAYIRIIARFLYIVISFNNHV